MDEGMWKRENIGILLRKTDYLLTHTGNIIKWEGDGYTADTDFQVNTPKAPIVAPLSPVPSIAVLGLGLGDRPKMRSATTPETVSPNMSRNPIRSSFPRYRADAGKVRYERRPTTPVPRLKRPLKEVGTRRTTTTSR